MPATALQTLRKPLEGAVQRGLRRCLGRTGYEYLRAGIVKGALPSLNEPTTFNEHLSHRKLFAPPRNAVQVSDKYRVRDYVRERVGDEILTPLLAVADTPEQVDLAALPEAFVCKATHGSGREFVEFVENRSALDPEDFRHRAGAMLARDFGWRSNESWYGQIDRRLIVEPLLRDQAHGYPLDYKFFVFHGRTAFIQVDTNRHQGHRRAVYWPDWTRASLRLNRHPEAPPVPRPTPLDEMRRIAEELGRSLEFVRVDLYCLDDAHIRFGELTLTPSGGWIRFDPQEWDQELGTLWRDPERDPEALRALA